MTRNKRREVRKSRVASHKFVTKPLHKKRKKDMSNFKLKNDFGHKIDNINVKSLEVTQLSSNKRLHQNANASPGLIHKTPDSFEHGKEKNAVAIKKHKQKLSSNCSSSVSENGSAKDVSKKAIFSKSVDMPKATSISQQSQICDKQGKTSSAAPDSSVTTTDAKIVAKGHHRKKKASNKQRDGSSNWMNLCKTLNIDATARKTKPLKQSLQDPKALIAAPEAKKAKPEIWFDHVDKIFIETEQDAVTDSGAGKASRDATDALVKPDSYKGLTNCVAMDCEMVGVGPQGNDSILARVSIVNHYGVCLYDKFVLPREKVTDYRTFVSGVTEENLSTGEDFLKVQREVSDILKDRVLVGHAIHNDLKVLYLTHPHKMIRDTSQFKPFRELFSGRIPALKKLADKVLGVSVQEGQHSSVQDAQAAMRLYTMYRKRWEKELKAKWKINKMKKKKKKTKP